MQKDVKPLQRERKRTKLSEKHNERAYGIRSKCLCANRAGGNVPST